MQRTSSDVFIWLASLEVPKRLYWRWEGCRLGGDTRDWAVNGTWPLQNVRRIPGQRHFGIPCLILSDTPARRRFLAASRLIPLKPITSRLLLLNLERRKAWLIVLNTTNPPLLCFEAPEPDLPIVDFGLFLCYRCWCNRRHFRFNHPSPGPQRQWPVSVPFSRFAKMWWGSQTCGTGNSMCHATPEFLTSSATAAVFRSYSHYFCRC